MEGVFRLFCIIGIVAMIRLDLVSIAGGAVVN